MGGGGMRHPPGLLLELYGQPHSLRGHHCSGPPFSEMTYCVEWDVKLYHTILYHSLGANIGI